MLHLDFSNGEINIYTCSVNILKAEVNQYYDWSDDVLNENWNPKKAKQSIDKIPDEMICDVILNQNIFSGEGIV
ncbi:hypothetical protein [Flavobacterium sp. N2038]|uniref:hypothetical protein n=1 Tax=Flavobacterium sp. N2038 TaxID=2986829 RepID=UPI0022241451|nr:hypothetical protein [Flavobacterium sp. N2038]